MDDQLILNCGQCNTPFVPKSADQILCLACEMQPDVVKTNFTESIDQIIYPRKFTYLSDEHKRPEILDSGLTKPIKKGSSAPESHLRRIEGRKHNKPFYREKNCKCCNKKFFPEYPRNFYCKDCSLTPKEKKIYRKRRAIYNREQMQYKIYVNNKEFTVLKKAIAYYGLCPEDWFMQAIRYFKEHYRCKMSEAELRKLNKRSSN